MNKQDLMRKRVGILSNHSTKENQEDFIQTMIYYQFELNIPKNFILAHINRYIRLFNEMPKIPDECWDKLENVKIRLEETMRKVRENMNDEDIEIIAKAMKTKPNVDIVIL